MRVPLVIVPPKKFKITAGRSQALASLLDLYPTLADISGLKVPDGLDGKSLKAVISGEQQQVRQYIVTTLGRSTFAIRRENWKYIRYYDGSEELYGLKSDPHEFHNLAAQTPHAAVLQQMRQLTPVDKRFKQMVRYGHYKGILEADGSLKVYDMMHPKSGIGEHTEVSAEKPQITEKIQSWFKANPLKRHGTLK